MWFGCAPAARVPGTLGALVRVLCACVVCARANSLRTQRDERVGAHGREDSAEKKERLPTRPSAMHACNPSRVSTLLSTRSVSADKTSSSPCIQAQELEETVEVGFAGRHGVLKGPSQSASAGSLSLHDTFCSVIIIFFFRSPLSHSVLPPSSSGRVEPHPQTKIGQDSVRCVRVCERERLDCV